MRPEAGLFLALAALLASSAQAAHPLITDDTGTQGKGGWQLEVNGERTRNDDVRATQSAAVLSYGALDNADLQLGLPYLRHQGRLDLAIDWKWRFFEQGALSLGLKPGVTLPTGDESRGLGAGRATWGSLLILSYEPEGAFAFHAHVGYRRNRNALGQRESLGQLSGAVLFKPVENLKLLLDLSRDTNPDAASRTAIRQAVVGAIWSPSKNVDLDLGIRRGNGAAPADRALLAGVTLRW